MSLLTETFDAVPGGMNLALPAWEIDDTECRYLQDGLVDYPGLCRRRGPVRKVNTIATFSRKGTGLVMTLNPQGTPVFGVLNGDNSNGFFSTLTSALTSSVDLTWPFSLPNTPPSQPYSIVDAKPALMGGLMLATSTAYDSNSPSQALAYWLGGNKANYTNSVTVARGSANLTGTGFNANVVPGMWVLGATDETYTGALIGCVRSVNSDTSITLTNVSPYRLTAKSVTFQSIRGFAPKVSVGEITCDTSSTQVTGGNTKFISQGLGTGTWQLYRASDMVFIGKVTSVQSEIALTLGTDSISGSANAQVAMSEQPYIAIRVDADYSMVTTASTQKVGFLNATYADRQWYANNGAQYEKTSRVWFSDTADPEIVDMSSFDGDWIDITSTATVNEPIRAIIPANNALVVLKENEAFTITGSSPESFNVRKVADDGVLNGMSAQSWDGGVIWAGREGVQFFDGYSVTNLTGPKLGDYYKNTLRTFDPTKYRMWSMMNRDHYFLFIENINPTTPIIKGVVSSTPNSWTLAINMATKAVSLMSNLHVRGAVVLPATAGRTAWYLVNGQVNGDTTDKAYICDGEAIFNEEATDPVYCDFGTSAVGTNIGGPDFYFESKKFYAGDQLRLKRFKQIGLEYMAQGGNLRVDLVTGLNNVGASLTSTFPASVYTWDTLRLISSTWDATKLNWPTWDQITQAVLLAKRVRFMRKSQFLSFRLWQSTNVMPRVRIGPYSMGYKLQRPGRV